jgi:hypothetical protein
MKRDINSILDDVRSMLMQIRAIASERSSDQVTTELEREILARAHVHLESIAGIANMALGRIRSLDEKI